MKYLNDNKLAFSVADSDGMEKQSIYSATQKSHRGGNVHDKKSRKSHFGSGGASNKQRRGSKHQSSQVVPQPQKLNLTERKLHKDDLDDSHFENQRFILHKKQQMKIIEAKMKAKKQRGGVRGSFNSDIESEL